MFPKPSDWNSLHGPLEGLLELVAVEVGAASTLARVVRDVDAVLPQTLL